MNPLSSQKITGAAIRSLMAHLLAATVSLGASNAVAAASAAEAGRPPATFRSDDVSFSIVWQPGHGPSLPALRIALSGKGSGTLQRGKDKSSFTYSGDDLFAVLNELYRIRYFDLPNDYTQNTSIFRREDGTLGTQSLRASDLSTTRVCLTIAAYEKCVTYAKDGPAELEQLVRRLIADVEQRTGTGR